MQRCKAVGATINEINVNTATREDVEKLVSTTGPWCGIEFDFTEKTVKLMKKAVDKTKLSWESRATWDWRAYARHMGLLFWPWRIIDLPMPEFFDVFRFNVEFSKMMTALQPEQKPDGTFPPNLAWDRPAEIAAHVWPVLEKWTNLVLKNEPSRVLPPLGPDSYDIQMVCDSSNEFGWCYVAVNVKTSEVFTYAQKWTDKERATYGDRLRFSTVAEPLGLFCSVQHLSLRVPDARRFMVGQDNTPTVFCFKRGFSTHSYHLNLMVDWLRVKFPKSDGFQFAFTHVPGAVILADKGSRGGALIDVKEKGIAEMLRSHLGLEKASACEVDAE